ncbi:MAG: nucleotidyltransferase family protein [Terracidiphilus sp.]|nr:nucleotidyltransferase family protein [Terracidiphilus sp.]MDR3797641.1 nucleotidyltransferase family protein [Terracidiphilus sp.]
MEAIVLAGGLGTRLASRLHGLPKPMAPIAGRPFLEILFTQLRRSGCTRVLLSVGHQHSVIQDHFGAAFDGMAIEYVIESVPLGTGGAIRLALAQAREESVLVLNGDTFLDADYAAMLGFHASEGAAVTLAVVHCDDVSRYGGVTVEGQRVVGFEEKSNSGPGWISAGTYVLARNLAWPSVLPEKFSIERDFFVPEVARLRPAAYEVDGFFLDIGIPEDLDRAQTALAQFLL